MSRAASLNVEAAQGLVVLEGLPYLLEKRKDAMSGGGGAVSWDPDRYLQFSDERLRPAADLVAQIPSVRPRRVVDLGCGAGNVTRLLQRRFPDAEITGIDSSSEMLSRAKSAVSGVRFESAQIEDWGSAEPTLDLVFSNSALHWVGDHPRLFPRLLAQLAPKGGVLAVQMPGNFGAPSHTLIRTLAQSPRWAARLRDAQMGAVLEMDAYYRLLAPQCSRIALWETTYWQQLRGSTRPVVDWLRGTTLLPYLSRLDTDAQRAFLDELAPALDAAYPAGADGTVLFPFRCVFIVAQR